MFPAQLWAITFIQRILPTLDVCIFFFLTRVFIFASLTGEKEYIFLDVYIFTPEKYGIKFGFVIFKFLLISNPVVFYNILSFLYL